MTNPLDLHKAHELRYKKRWSIKKIAKVTGVGTERLRESLCEMGIDRPLRVPNVTGWNFEDMEGI